MKDMKDQARVDVIVGDEDCLTDLFEVVAILKENRVQVRWIVDIGLWGAVLVLEKYEILYEVRGPSITDNPSVILSACNNERTDAAQMLWTAWARSRRAKGGSIIPIIWYKKTSAGSIRPNMLGYSPDVLILNYEFLEKSARQYYPNVEIAVVGQDKDTAKLIAAEVMKYL